MIEMIIICTLLFLGLPFLAILLFTLWSFRSMELNRNPTKEEWKAGKRRKQGV